jgi:hypothetical protein
MLNFFKKLKKSSNIMYLQVPKVCKTRRDKNLLIEETLKHLERNIKINQ